MKPGMTVVDLGAAPGGWTQMPQKDVEEAVVVALYFTHGMLCLMWSLSLGIFVKITSCKN
ncbi:hypothetical protein PGH44_00020 [Legionella pneumophila]|nr:hypothetical protein PGH44_00020 [Legionella pneumophila]